MSANPLPIMERLDGYEDSAICAVCGGKCCKRVPGIYLPSDLLVAGEDPVTTLARLFASGKLAFDWWVGDPNEERDEVDRGYFVRPARLGHGPRDPVWFNEAPCIHLTPVGCELSLADRPAGCRLVEPTPTFECEEPGETKKQQAALTWEPWWPAITEAAKLSGKT